MANATNNKNVEVNLTPEQLATIKAQLKEEIKAEMQADTEKSQENTLDKNEAVLAKAEKKMKDILLADPKKKIFIPKDPNNPDERYPIAVNGVIFSVKRGEMVDVPESVAKVWEYSYKETEKIKARITVKNITNGDSAVNVIG